MKKKTIFGIRTRLSDSDIWSETRRYRRRGNRDKCGSMNRILGGIRTHSFEEKKTQEEIEELEFQD